MLAERLKKGDTIGVIAPDKALKSEQREYLENATKYFESIGLKVKYGKYLVSDTEYCAGTPKQRAEDLNNMFADKDVKAISTIKGGNMANGIIGWNTMLEQYNQMGAFNKAVVFGYIYQLQYKENNKYDIVNELKKINSNIPIVKTDDFGHLHANSIIPIGVNVTINGIDKKIELGDFLK